MLNIFFGDVDDAIYNTSTYFKNSYKDTWFQDEFAQRMIKSIDRATPVGDGVFDSHVLGKITPLQFSGGLKTLLLIYNVPDLVFNASTCGDNCAWWILRIAKLKEPTQITINLHHLMNFGGGKFSVRVLNSGQIVHDMMGIIEEAMSAFEESFRAADRFEMQLSVEAEMPLEYHEGAEFPSEPGL